MSTLADTLIRHEGLKLKPYRCTEGKLTIGVGRNLDDVGITEAEARMMLGYDIARVEHEALKFKWYSYLSEPRKEVILNMLFNLGLTRFNKFKKFKECLELGQYDLATKEMLNSKWAKDVGDRAKELAAIMKKG